VRNNSKRLLANKNLLRYFLLIDQWWQNSDSEFQCFFTHPETSTLTYKGGNVDIENFEALGAPNTSNLMVYRNA